MKIFPHKTKSLQIDALLSRLEICMGQKEEKNKLGKEVEKVEKDVEKEAESPLKVNQCS